MIRWLLASVVIVGAARAHAQKPTTARTASAFADSVGVNVHLPSKWDTAYGDCANGRSPTPPCAPSVARIGSALNYLGVRHIRDGITAPYVATRVRELAAIVPGLHLDTILGDDRAGSLEDQLAVAAPVFDLIDVVEGPNEPNNPGFKFRYHKHPFPTGVTEEMRDLTALLPHTAFAGVPIANVGLGGGTEADPGRLGVIPGTAYATAHAYYGVTAPKRFTRGLDPARNMTPGRPMLITETGNCTPTVRMEWCAVTEAVQAKYTLMAVADAFEIGVARIYLYELVDEKLDLSGTDIEQHFGLFYTDWLPKPAAKALANLHNEVGGGGRPGSLGYTLTGTRNFLLRRSDGVYLIVAWFDTDLWDAADHVARNIRPRPTVLELSKTPTGVEIFDPLDGNRRFVGTGKSVSLDLPDHPVVIEVKPE